MAKKKAPAFKAKGLKDRFSEAFGKMKEDRMKKRSADAKDCACGGKGCKKCDCGK
jgi:hypothetical protein